MAATLTLSADLTRRNLGNSSLTEESPSVSNALTFREKPEVPVAPQAINTLCRFYHASVESFLRSHSNESGITSLQLPVTLI
jgi:hypothetical protein